MATNNVAQLKLTKYVILSSNKMGKRNKASNLFKRNNPFKNYQFFFRIHTYFSLVSLNGGLFKRGENVEYNYDNHVLLFHYYLEKIERSVRGENLGFLQLQCWKYWTWKEQNNKSKNSRTNLIINEKNRKKIAKELVYTQVKKKVRYSREKNKKRLFTS